MADLEWYYPETEKGDRLYQILVRKKAIGVKTRRAAGVIGATARSLHTPHARNNDRRAAVSGEGRSSISVTRGSSGVDAFVNLDDPDGAALAIEGKLNILRRAAGTG